MEDKRLDKIIGDKLGEFEMPYKSNSWDALADRLNDVEATEHFDESMRRKLSDIEMSYQPLYWDLLAQRLEQETTFQKQLLRYKATEILLVLLILITFVQIFPNQTMKNILPLGQGKVFNEINLTDQVDTNIDENSNDLFHKKAEDSNSKIAKLSNQETKLNIKSYSPNSSHVDRKPASPQELETLWIPLNSKVATAALPITVYSADEDQQQVENTEKPISPVVEPIFSGSITLLQKNAALILLEAENEQIKKGWRIGMAASSNIDYIQTPYDEIYNKSPISRFDFGGYSGGVSISKKKNRWELETGLIYSHKAYKPTDPRLAYYGNITEGYNVEGLKDIELNTIQVPVNVSYDVVQKEKWNFYVLGGASINVAIVANYDVGKVSALALNVPSSVVKNGEILELSERQQELFDEQSIPSEPESPALSRRKFSNGVFKGGSYKENSFYTANIGFGMERHLDERLSIFFQPTYRQHLTILNEGIGPNIDRISTLNVLIGAKVGF